jgi:hypothetical protein
MPNSSCQKLVGSYEIRITIGGRLPALRNAIVAVLFRKSGNGAKVFNNSKSLSALIGKTRGEPVGNAHR